MQAEPPRRDSLRQRADAAAALREEYAWQWKIDLHSAYRSWANAKRELWMYGKQWGGRSYLDVRAQFGDASMVACLRWWVAFFVAAQRWIASSASSALSASCCATAASVTAMS